MDKIRGRNRHVAIICSLLVIPSIVFLISCTGPTGRFGSLFLFRSYQSCQPRTQVHITRYTSELDEVLSKTSKGNKTVIITVVNKAYVENDDNGNKSMLDLFLDGFWVGEDTRDLIDHVLIVAVDRTAYDRCRFLRLHCYKLETDGVDFEGGSEKFYMSGDFIKMMWRRTLFLGDVLRLGYDFVFTDTDILWLRNPFQRLLPALNDTVDIQISTDIFNGHDWSEKNLINTGFYFIRSNDRTISLFDEWYARRTNATGLKEQDVLSVMMKRGVPRQMGLRVKFLDTHFFSGFCQDSKDVRVVITVHANCCRTISAKLVDLTAVIRDWKRFKRVGLAANRTMRLGGRRHVACVKSWRGFNFTR